MKLKIEIVMDNAAFEEPRTGAEVARILRDYAKTVEDAPGPVNLDGSPMVDVNGNTVGRAKVTR